LKVGKFQNSGFVHIGIVDRIRNRRFAGMFVKPAVLKILLNYQHRLKGMSGLCFSPLNFLCLCLILIGYICVVQVGVYLQLVVVPRLCLSGEGVWHQGEYLRLLVPALRNT